MSALELGVEDALAELQSGLVPIAETEEAALGDAPQRVLARELVSPIDLPAFDNAAMDGYAVRAEDAVASAKLSIIGRALAGHAFAGEVGPQQTVRILTGAPLPRGADAVVINEETRVDGDHVTIERPVTPGANVRRRGEHVSQGDAVLPRGRRLRASDLGVAASIGASTLTVVRRPRVGVLSTGDELVDAPAMLSASAAYDGNRPFLIALLQRAGCIAVDLGIAADTADALVASLANAESERVDLVLTTGGAAQGDADFVRRHGEVRFIAVNFRPGRGIAAGTLRAGSSTIPLFGLPGNAVAAYVMYQLIVRPLLGCIAGAGLERPLVLSLPLASSARCRPGRIEWRRARWRRIDGHLAVELLKDQGSAMLRTVSEADALVAIGPQEHSAAGTPVSLIALDAID